MDVELIIAIALGILLGAIFTRIFDGLLDIVRKK